MVQLIKRKNLCLLSGLFDLKYCDDQFPTCACTPMLTCVCVSMGDETLILIFCQYLLKGRES